MMRTRPRLTKVLLFLVVVGFSFNVILLFKMKANHSLVPAQDHIPATIINDHQPSDTIDKPVVWIYAKKDLAMSHVLAVFNRLGYRVQKPGESWDVMWSHSYPFNTFKEDLQKLQPHQKINHFPGTSCLVSKPKLATHGFSFTPRAYRIPDESEQFLEDVKNRPNTLWVQKNNKHRGIQIKKPKDISMKNTGIFVQEFITNPILIDGRKFDIGIYTLITSIDPLVVYIYQEEMLVRFCSKDYLPFDEKDKKRYVVDDYYTPSWEIPSMKPLLITHGLSHKEALNIVLQGKGMKTDQFWKDTYTMIQKVLYHCETAVLNITESYASKRNFFELVRFDFIIDEDFKPWLMEVNLSPNLSSSHTPGNRNMYEQIVYNVLHIVGLNRGTLPGLRYNGKFESTMFVNEYDIQTPIQMCLDSSCSDCNKKICHLCKHCRHESLEFTLRATFMEYLSRRNFQRLIPGPFAGCSDSFEQLQLSATHWSHPKTRLNNELVEMWFYGKCCQFPQWCK